MKPRKVLAIASSGGHWVQMRRLTPAFEDCDVAFVSTYKDYAHDVAGHRFYAVADVTRRKMINLVRTVPQFVVIMLRERPDVVITTGSMPGLVGLAVAKALTGARTMWIDSIANCDELSSSGRQARRFADHWLTQWEALARPEGPEYWGAVL
jgi:UDP-N-acetylglucosamine:LPS N-acetylglucosamine transferase